MQAVRRDNKQRFSLIEENGEFLIRANQGHSITVRRCFSLIYVVLKVEVLPCLLIFHLQTVESEKLLKPILSPEEAPGRN